MIGCQIYIAHKNSRLLKAHFDSYRYDYKPRSWYYNAGIVSTNVLLKNPNLAKIVDYKLGTHYLTNKLYKYYWPKWREMEAMHLLINHRLYMQPHTPKEFDEFNIWNINYTYGEMCRDVLKRANLFIPKFV